MKTALLFFGMLAVAFSGSALAQSAPSTSATMTTPSHLKAAETMVSLSSSAEAYNKKVDQKLDMMFKQLPDRADKKEVQERMRAFLSKYLSWDSMRLEVVALYVNKFTEVEIQEIIKFYQTPAGQKLALIGPQLSQAQMEIGQRRMQEHMTEFQQLFDE